MASDMQDWIHDELDVLRRTRDELRVQLHLGATEVRDAWAKLETSWEHLEGRIARVSDATHETTDDVEDATRLLVDELKQGYERIKRAL